MGRTRTALLWLSLTGLAIGAVWLDRRARSYSAGMVPPLVDWERVRELAFSLVRDGTMPDAAREEINAIYRGHVDRAVEEIAAFTGLRPPLEPMSVSAFDRFQWIEANISGFKRLFDPIERVNFRISVERPWGGILMGGINRFVISHEIGFLLGYLSHRVLGQYDIAVFGTGPLQKGQLYFVEPNITSLVSHLGVPVDEFRLWIALHETSHAFEFEGNEWLVPHFNHLLERYFTAALEELSEGGIRRFLEGWTRIVDGMRRGQPLVEAILSPRQLAIFHTLQALMAVVEGYSNYVMNSLGQRLMPSFRLIKARFEERQRYRSTPEHLFIRLTGLSLKLEQYRLGEAFVTHLAAKGGLALVNKLWEGPQYLPTLDELRRPDLWARRIESL